MLQLFIVVLKISIMGFIKIFERVRLYMTLMNKAEFIYIYKVVSIDEVF